MSNANTHCHARVAQVTLAYRAEGIALRVVPDTIQTVDEMARGVKPAHVDIKVSRTVYNQLKSLGVTEIIELGARK